MSEEKSDYWDGYSQGMADGPGGAPVRDACEGFIEAVSFGVMSSRSDAEKAGIDDGREGLHEDD